MEHGTDMLSSNSSEDSNDNISARLMAAPFTMKDCRVVLESLGYIFMREDLVHLQFPHRDVPMEELKKMFFTKTLQACKETRFEGDLMPNFNDITLVDGKPSLRLENYDHIQFFSRIIRTM